MAVIPCAPGPRVVDVVDELDLLAVPFDRCRTVTDNLVEHIRGGATFWLTVNQDAR